MGSWELMTTSNRDQKHTDQLDDLHNATEGLRGS